jgi:transcriptional regulator with XRE-family HTH domain
MDRVFTYSPEMASRGSPDDEEKPVASPTAQLLAENLKNLMKAYPELGSNPKLGKKTGLGASGISRLVNGHNATIETLERISKAFGLEPWQLLVQGLDPKSQPTLQPLSKREAALYAKWKALARETTEDR